MGRRPHSSIDGERVFAYVNSYTTKTVESQVELEGHRKYIDLQFLVDGEESIGWTPTERARRQYPYNPETDAWTGMAAADRLNWVKIKPGLAGGAFSRGRSRSSMRRRSTDESQKDRRESDRTLITE